MGSTFLTGSYQERSEKKGMGTMKVLHIWNTAGVASTLALYQNKLLKWDTWVITRSDADKFGHTIFGETCRCSPAEFIVKAIKMARQYDVIHVHSLDRLIKTLKILYKDKIVILHYHGSDIRGLWEHKADIISRADVVVVSTPDLFDEGKQYGVYYLPNPVNLDLFRPMEHLRSRHQSAIYIYDPSSWALRDVDYAREIANNMKLKLYIHDRNKRPIPYRYMPYVFNKFWYLIDKLSIYSLSLTALEALACNVKVVKRERIVEELPREHTPIEVLHTLLRIMIKIM